MKKTLVLAFPRMALPVAAAALGLILVGLITRANAATPLGRQLDFGARGNDVIQLQTFLATSNLIYPEGIVSGYYGALTRKAVMQFQTMYDLPQVGRVGPMTMAKLNALMTASATLDVSAPVVRAITLQPTRAGATIIWGTNEAARGTVFYDANPIALAEAQTMLGAPYVSGTAATNDGGLRNEQSVTLSGLQPNTSYYYAIRSTDAAGNATFTWPALLRTQE